MKLKDRLYWFGYNFPRGIVCLFCIPVGMIIASVELLYIMFFVTDGSSYICWPWENNNESN